MESAAAAPQACAAAISTAKDKMRQKTDPGNDFDLSDETTSSTDQDGEQEVATNDGQDQPPTNVSSAESEEE